MEKGGKVPVQSGSYSGQVLARLLPNLEVTGSDHVSTTLFLGIYLSPNNQWLTIPVQDSMKESGLHCARERHEHRRRVFHR
ncbi:hypothetical protein QJS04_geneDACA014033 [Acorus gramineus]|uniref:Uncharacterized protein n=1 Tax=Acorus gramineus TaxID=55184 RepID=A0AAV9AVD3_ACOGR|nr:hypothetical protein QJS04_geneDACA014033 [Acorus gramineus]